MMVRIEDSWKEALCKEFEKPYFVQLTEFVRQEYATKQVFPPGKEIFKAFDSCSLQNVKVVIIGQDPYHGVGQANGLCFSVNDGVQIPPSLLNIYKEINREYGSPMPSSGNLQRWAEQGVLLLNATLTVEAHKAGSHQNKGWESFTDAAIQAVAQRREHIVFMLWGSYAQKKGAFIDPLKHCILTSPHPSPLSAHRGFIGNGHFMKANQYLEQHGISPINW
ncbi:MAG: uracil-DNA glycosylase [Paludibacteraceae bacterium]|nr:uracil-DNA glycosylase [Paludibacteraceae bacterium]